MPNKQVMYDINFNVDMSSLELLKEALNNIQTMSSSTYIKINGAKDAENQLKQLKTTASQVEIAMDAAFNPKLNTLNLDQFNAILQKSGLTIQEIGRRFNSAGDNGKRAFRDLTEQLFTANTELKKSKTFLENIGDTLFNAAKWSMAYGVINLLQNGIRQAWTYSVSLDSALNDIRIVTGKSYEDMEKFAKSANKAAKALGTSTIDYTQGSLIYYQQGLSDKQVQARTSVSAKVANVTGQSMQEVSEELTAVWNGFQVSAENAESYVDKLAAVAASSASDLEELSTAMSRVASSANTMGINVDQLTAQIATIESVTRQDAASIGTALKTIYARMGDLAIGAEDEFGVALGDVSGKMKQMGIDILDQSGNMRDMGAVIEEVAAKWGTWTEAQQQAAAVALAGKRQYNNLFALFENWDMYEANKTISENSLGELQKQQDIYMESTKAHLEKLQNASEGLKDSLFNNKSVNQFLDVLTFGIEQIESLVTGLGGAGNIILGVFSSLGNIYSNKIGQSIGGILSNLGKVNDTNQSILNKAYLQSEYADASEEAINKMVSLQNDKLKYEDVLTENEKERYNILIKQTNELETQKELIKYNVDAAGKGLSASKNKSNILMSGVSNNSFKDENGKFTTLNLDNLLAMSEKDVVTIKQNINKEQKELTSRQKFINDFSMADIKNATRKNATNRQKNSAENSIRNLLETGQSQLNTGINQNSKAYQELEAAVKALNMETEKGKQIDLESSEVKQAATEVAEKLAQVLEEEGVTLQAVERTMSEAIPKYQAIKNAIEALKKEQEKMAERARIQELVQNITSVTSALMQIGSIIASLKNVFETYADASVGWGEKIKQTVYVVLALIPVILSAAKAFSMQLKLSFPELTAILAIITLVIAGITALISILGKQETALEKAQKAYDKSVESLNEMKSALTETKNAYEELKDTINDYQSQRDAIDQLTIGTEQFSEAIIKANTMALGLIQNYKLLGEEYYSIDKNGLINISQAGLDEILNQQKDKINTQSRSITLQQLDVYQKKNELLSEELKDNQTLKDIVDVVNRPRRQQIQALTSTGNSYITEATRSQFPEIIDLNDYLDQIQRDFKAAGSEDSYFLSSNFEELTASLADNDDNLKAVRDIIKENIVAIRDNSKQIDLLKVQYAKQYLIDTSNNEYAQAIDKEAFAKAYAARIDSISEKYTDSLAKAKDASNNAGFVNSKIESEVKNYYGAEKVSVTDEGKITLIYGDGSSQVLDENTVREDLNQQTKAIIAEQISKTILEQQTKDAQNGLVGLSDLSGGSAAILTKANIRNIPNGSSELWDPSIWTEDRLLAYGFYNNETGEVDRAKAIGAQKRSQEMTKQALEKIKNRLENTNTNFESSLFDDLNLNELSNVVSGLEAVYKATGTTSGFTELLSQVTTAEQKAAIGKVAAQVDWTSMTAIYDFNKALKEMGVNIDYSSNAYKNFVKEMQNSVDITSLLVRDYENIANILKELHDVIDDLSLGDILSEEEYQLLLNYNSELEKYFILTSQGRKFIGSKDDLVISLFNRFSSFEDIEGMFQKLKEVGEILNNTSFNSQAIGDKLEEETRRLTTEIGLNQDQLQLIYKTAGINQNSFNDAYNRLQHGDYTEQDTQLIQKVLNAANDIITNTQNNYYSSDNAAQIAFTSTNKTLKEAKAAYENNTISKEAYNKIKQYWLANYAETFSMDIKVIEKLADKLEKTGEELYQRLTFLSTYQDLIDNIEQNSSNLTGDQQAASLKKQIDFLTIAKNNLKENIEIEKEILGIKIEQLDYEALLIEYQKISNSLSDDEKKNWEDLLKDAKKYEEIMSSITDNIIAISAAQIEAAKNITDLQKTLREFNANYYNTNGSLKNAFELQEALSIDSRKQIQQENIKDNQALIQEYDRQIAKLQRDLANETDINKQAQFKKAIEEYEAGRRDAIESEINSLKELYQIWSDGWDEITKKCDKYKERVEKLNSLYDRQISLMKIVNKNYFSAEILNTQADNLKRTIESSLLSYQEALKRYNLATTDTEKEVAETALNSAAETYLSVVEDYYNKLKSNFEAFVNNIYEQMGVSTANERWSRTEEYNDQYLNVADIQMNINKIRKQYQTAIDSANSLNAQTQLRVKMEEELVKLQEKKDKLTQYEVDRANAVYELTLKQIALEESQRNASQMKLVRDSNGNLTYAFTQNQDITSQAQADLEEAQNNLFNIDNDQLRSQIDKYYQYQETAQAELAAAAAEGDQERYNELVNYYYGSNGIITQLQERLPEIQENLKASFKDIIPTGDVNSLFTYTEAASIIAVNLSNTKTELINAYNTFVEKFTEFDTDLTTALSKLTDKDTGLIAELQKNIYTDSYKKDVASISASLVSLNNYLLSKSFENSNSDQNVDAGDNIGSGSIYDLNPDGTSTINSGTEQINWVDKVNMGFDRNSMLTIQEGMGLIPRPPIDNIYLPSSNQQNNNSSQQFIITNNIATQLSAEETAQFLTDFSAQTNGYAGEIKK